MHVTRSTFRKLKSHCRFLSARCGIFREELQSAPIGPDLDLSQGGFEAFGKPGAIEFPIRPLLYSPSRQFYVLMGARAALACSFQR
jgi:hypothetical protein